jgi:hypothetical protein
MSDSITCDDFEENTSKSKKSDFMSLGGNVFYNINYKLPIFMFLIGMLIFSDLFIENCLYNSAVDGEMATTKGTMIQLLLFCIILVVLDLLIKYKFI